MITDFSKKVVDLGLNMEEKGVTKINQQNFSEVLL
jgi:hypothetical protein